MWWWGLGSDIWVPGKEEAGGLDSHIRGEDVVVTRDSGVGERGGASNSGGGARLKDTPLQCSGSPSHWLIASKPQLGRRGLTRGPSLEGTSCRVPFGVYLLGSE